MRAILHRLRWQTVKILFCGELDDDEVTLWLGELARAWPQGEWLRPDAARESAHLVRAAVVARPPPGSLKGFPNLALIQSLWAGVDSLLADPTLPADVPLARMVDPAMNVAMAETALWATLSLQRDCFRYAQQQQARRWQAWPQRRADEWRVGVLGLGEMGLTVASRLHANGFDVMGWARRPRSLPRGVTGFFGAEALPRMASRCDMLINLLPLTDQTRGLLAQPLFQAMQRGARLVNLGRGAHLNEADLLAALDTGQLSHAVLDVFAVEPLPAAHAFWARPDITILPHAAAATDPRSAAAVVAANLDALLEGRALAHLVERARGY